MFLIFFSFKNYQFRRLFFCNFIFKNDARFLALYGHFTSLMKKICTLFVISAILASISNVLESFRDLGEKLKLFKKYIHTFVFADI